MASGGCVAAGASFDAAAQRRLQEAADAIIARVIGFALDNGVPDDIAPKAVIAAADRAGFSVKPSATLEVSTKPYEIVLDNLDNLTGGSRAEVRRSQGGTPRCLGAGGR